MPRPGPRHDVPALSTASGTTETRHASKASPDTPTERVCHSTSARLPPRPVCAPAARAPARSALARPAGRASAASGAAPAPAASRRQPDHRRPRSPRAQQRQHQASAATPGLQSWHAEVHAAPRLPWPQLRLVRLLLRTWPCRDRGRGCLRALARRSPCRCPTGLPQARSCAGCTRAWATAGATTAPAARSARAPRAPRARGAPRSATRLAGQRCALTAHARAASQSRQRVQATRPPGRTPRASPRRRAPRARPRRPGAAPPRPARRAAAGARTQRGPRAAWRRRGASHHGGTRAGRGAAGRRAVDVHLPQRLLGGQDLLNLLLGGGVRDLDALNADALLDAEALALGLGGGRRRAELGRLLGRLLFRLLLLLQRLLLLDCAPRARQTSAAGCLVSVSNSEGQAGICSAASGSHGAGRWRVGCAWSTSCSS